MKRWKRKPNPRQVEAAAREQAQRLRLEFIHDTAVEAWNGYLAAQREWGRINDPRLQADVNRIRQAALKCRMLYINTASMTGEPIDEFWRDELDLIVEARRG